MKRFRLVKGQLLPLRALRRLLRRQRRRLCHSESIINVYLAADAAFYGGYSSIMLGNFSR